MIQVVDASVAAKWFFPERGDQEARALVESGRPLIAPDLIVPEVCNVAWRKAAGNQITAETAQHIGLQLPALLNRLIPGRKFLKVIGRAGFSTNNIRLISELSAR